ncbi:hypothetical protein PENFLA_c084G10899 [Penicillium flavigenum]|uniref:Uncharacterized protein n=1 Tax=Penicillium flavigenum TaxID=254877 RepID=A0A1V6S9D9_9EURO|nr:hypothetical protein PENFLA_c084G10899 [Penicillium flavigenum]
MAFYIFLPPALYFVPLSGTCLNSLHSINPFLRAQHLSEYCRRHDSNPPRMIFLAITWLALTSLSSATVHFAVLLGDRAKSDLVTPSDSIMDITFQSLMDNAVDGMVIVALISALVSIFGFVLVFYQKWLQENCAARFYYGRIQIVVSMIVLS